MKNFSKISFLILIMLALWLGIANNYISAQSVLAAKTNIEKNIPEDNNTQQNTVCYEDEELYNDTYEETIFTYSFNIIFCKSKFKFIEQIPSFFYSKIWQPPKVV